VDLDFYVPAAGMPSLLPDLGGFLKRPLGEYRGEEWRLRYLKVEYDGWAIEVAEAEGAQFLNRVADEWEDQGIDFSASVVRPVAGVSLSVMPLAQLMDYKRKLDREVDKRDVADLVSKGG
jgi:hypothetical protein